MTMDPRLMANALMPRQSDQLMDNWYQQNKLLEQTPPWQQNAGILSNTTPRPQDWHNRSGVTDYVANAINPAMIGYGAGQMAGEARNALLEGHYGEAGGLGILAAMAVMPGAKARPSGTVRLYHGTTDDGLAGILRDGKILGPVYLAHKDGAAQYGKHVIPVDVQKQQLMIDRDLGTNHMFSVEDANAYLGNRGFTIDDYLQSNRGAFAVPHDIDINKSLIER